MAWNNIMTLSAAPALYHVEPELSQAFLCARGPATQDIREVIVDTFYAPEIELVGIFATIVNRGTEIPEGCMLVFNAQTGAKVIEKDMDALTAKDMVDHWDKVEQAIKKEIKSFQDLDTFEPVDRHTVPNVLSSKWVLRWKLIDGQRAVKARLTVRGFQDTAKASLDTYAGTATRWGQRIIVAIAAQQRWKIQTADVTAAFLQGLTFKELAVLNGEEERRVAFVPPAGYEKYFSALPGMGHLDFNRHILLMRKPIYGLCDAPRAWRKRLDQLLKQTGGASLFTDQALYVWKNAAGNMTAVASTHVDDLKLAGEPPTIKIILEALATKFGTLKVQVDSFDHCGVRHIQHANGDITLDQEAYAKQLRLVDMSKINVTDENQKLDDETTRTFQSLLGGLSWLTQTRMDIAIYVQALQRASKNPKIGHLLKLNKVTKWVQRKKACLRYARLEGPVKLVIISDSAFRKEDESGLAMRGAVIALAEQRQGHPGGQVQVLEFYSRRQRRVTRSTFGAELHGLADSTEIAKLICFALSEILLPVTIKPADLVRREETGGLALDMEAVIDCKSVFDALANPDTQTPSESSLIMILCQLKELLTVGTLRKLWWVDTVDMAADGLNKGAVGRNGLLSLGITGLWTLTKECVCFMESRRQGIPDKTDLDRL
jgi:Reverse transcriptase (RNA-dependent DNA polymerase)